MSRLGIFLLVIILRSGLSGQITVTQDIFPQVGDTLHYAVDDQPVNIIMTPPDFAPQNWDFSGLKQASSFDIIMEDAQTGPEFPTFPGAQLVYTLGADRTYLEVNGQNVTELGFVGDPAGLGVRLNSVYYPGYIQMRAPVQFFDLAATSSGFLTAFPTGNLPGASQLPFIADSLRIRMSTSRLDAIDAFGNLTIPGGTFEVLREKRTRYREQRIDGKIAPLGWLDVTDLTLTYYPTAYLGVDTLVTYYFWSNQSKEPIAICFTDNSQLRVVKVQYKNIQASTTALKKEELAIPVSVYPNPAGEVLHLRTGDLALDNYRLSVYDLLGREIVHKEYDQLSGHADLTVRMDAWTSGTYFCTLSNTHGLIGQVRFMKE